VSRGEDTDGPEGPAYRVYRTRRGPFRWLRGPRGFRDPTRAEETAGEAGPKRGPLRPRRRGLARPRITRRGLIRRLIVFAVAWVALSVILFAVSAQIQQTKFDGQKGPDLGGGNLLTGGSTILLLGSDRRPENSGEPGADTLHGRADTIMLLRVGAGKGAKLSIPRDSYAAIPGFGAQKINAAFALGGAALEAKAVSQFMGVRINHVIEIDFDGFEKFIDALGGVRIKVGHCVVSRINGGFRNGGFTLRLRPGEHTLNGEQALALARTRNNLCNRFEDDRTRARRQQQIFAAVKSRMTDPLRLPRNFLFGPWLGWTAPRALISDMGGLTMTEFVLANLVSGNPKPRVLRPSGPGPGGSLIIPESERRQQAERFLRG
jgi:LCP family protein required for cell wall assembly